MGGKKDDDICGIDRMTQVNISFGSFSFLGWTRRTGIVQSRRPFAGAECIRLEAFTM